MRRVKIRDKDLEQLLRKIEKEMEELKDSLRDSFLSLKKGLKRNDWWRVTVDAEDIIEDASQLQMLEDVYRAIKEKIEVEE